MSAPWCVKRIYSQKIDPMAQEVLDGKILAHSFEVILEGDRGGPRRVALCAQETDAQIIAESLMTTHGEERQ